MPGNTLGAADRIKSRKLVEAIFAEGASLGAFPVKAIYRIAPAPDAEKPGVQIGASVSKRHYKHATDRNRGKRLLREAYRKHKHALVEAACRQQVRISIFWLITDRQMPPYQLVEQKMILLLRKLCGIVRQVQPPSTDSHGQSLL